MRDLLRDILRDYSGFVELRYHSKVFRSVTAEKGRIERTAVRRRSGVGVRVLEDGTWGFAATGDLSPAAIRKAIAEAQQAARASANCRKQKLKALPRVQLAQGEFCEPGVEEVVNKPLEAKIQLALETEAQARKSSTRITSASCTYNEIYEEKAIVTTDGADIAFRLVRPELRVQAVAEADGQLSSGTESIGVTGGVGLPFSDGSLTDGGEGGCYGSGSPLCRLCRGGMGHRHPLSFHRGTAGA
jgi:TldD protein